MTVYLCKNCIHSRMSLVNKIFTFGGRVGDDEIFYKCNKFSQPAKEIVDVVIGVKKVPAKQEFCELARNNPDKCGPQAKHWSPKKKKDLFKMLTKEHYD